MRMVSFRTYASLKNHGGDGEDGLVRLVQKWAAALGTSPSCARDGDPLQPHEEDIESTKRLGLHGDSEAGPRQGTGLASISTSRIA